MSRVTDGTHRAAAAKLRAALAKYQEIELLLQVGEYKPGAARDAAFAVERIAAIRGLLRQGAAEPGDYQTSLQQLQRLFA